MPHPAPVPIPLVAGIVVRLRPLGKIEERSSVAVEQRFYVVQCFAIADLSNGIAERQERLVRDLAQTKLAPIAQFPDRRVHVAGKWIAVERLLRNAPSFPRGMFA